MMLPGVPPDSYFDPPDDQPCCACNCEGDCTCLDECECECGIEPDFEAIIAARYDARYDI